MKRVRSGARNSQNGPYAMSTVEPNSRKRDVGLLDASRTGPEVGWIAAGQRGVGDGDGVQRRGNIELTKMEAEKLRRLARRVRERRRPPGPVYQGLVLQFDQRIVQVAGPEPTTRVVGAPSETA
jgi:hypothetical protein